MSYHSSNILYDATQKSATGFKTAALIRCKNKKPAGSFYLCNKTSNKRKSANAIVQQIISGATGLNSILCRVIATEPNRVTK